MTRSAFRITKTHYVPTAFDGEGARRYGGRWNSPGTRVVYIASSLSLATLELLVHVEDLTLIKDAYRVIPVEFEQSLVRSLRLQELPEGWDDPVPSPPTREVGDRWVNSGESPILEIPSAVVPSETNFLVNPSHEEFSRIRFGEPVPLRLDERLG